VTWGVFSVPQGEFPLFPDDVAGLDAIELGCGTAYVSSWLARRGARAVGHASGFEVEGLIEIYAPEGAADSSYAYAPAGWSRQWPVEEIWKARKI
jgi:hypothetical protein